MADISFYSKEKHSNRVLQQLRQKLYQHSVHDWLSDQPDPATIDYAVCWHPPAEFFDGATNLQAIFSLAAGVDHLLKHPRLPASVPIVRLTDAGMADKIAEYVHYGVLRTHRGFHRYHDLQQQQLWQPQPDRHAADYRVGILGYGVIGQAVGLHLHRAGYQVSAFKRSHADNQGPVKIMTGDHSGFLKQLDVLVCILPLTSCTQNLIDADFLADLPEGSHFINVGRGDQVVENDLLSALDSGRLASALLDVCSVEPLPAEHDLWRHPRVVITPHVAGPTQVTQSVDQVAESIIKLSRGGSIGALPGVVDMLRGY
ncbi:MAG: NAD(P)-dependent oxidoreductase [Pseudomonadota bacterium]